MRHVEFQRFLSEENILRVRFSIDRGQVRNFTVRLECNFAESREWAPVVRYDTAHGFAHCDRMHPYADVLKTQIPTHNLNEALTFAIEDLVENWGCVSPKV